MKPLQILSINLKPLKEQTILKFCVKMMRKRLYVLTLLSSSCAIRSSTEHRIAHRLRCSCRCVDATHLSTHLTGGTFLTWLASLPQEVAIKLPISILFFSLECGGVLTAMRAIAVDLRERPVEWAQLAVPAMLYTLQNTMLYVGFANVEAAVGQVTYQSKILWTALFSVIILQKKLTLNQWFALTVLALGVVAVQGVDSGSGSSATKPAKRVGGCYVSCLCVSKPRDSFLFAEK